MPLGMSEMGVGVIWQVHPFPRCVVMERKFKSGQMQLWLSTCEGQMRPFCPDPGVNGSQPGDCIPVTCIPAIRAYPRDTEKYQWKAYITMECTTIPCADVLLYCILRQRMSALFEKHLLSLGYSTQGLAAKVHTRLQCRVSRRSLSKVSNRRCCFQHLLV